MAVTGGRSYQQGSVLSGQVQKPYVVHHFGNNTDEGLCEEDDAVLPNRQFLTIYLHTAQGDYGPLDDMMPLVKGALFSLADRPSSLIQLRYLETSQDMQDDLLQTYFRYMRFQLACSR
jgi:hypothetical protein